MDKTEGRESGMQQEQPKKKEYTNRLVTGKEFFSKEAFLKDMRDQTNNKLVQFGENTVKIKEKLIAYLGEYEADELTYEELV